MARPLPTVGAMSHNQTGFGCPMGHVPAPAPTAGCPPVPSLPPRPATFPHVILCTASTWSPPHLHCLRSSPPPMWPLLFTTHHPPPSLTPPVLPPPIPPTPMSPHPPPSCIAPTHTASSHTATHTSSTRHGPHHHVSPLMLMCHGLHLHHTQLTATLHLHFHCCSSLAHRHHCRPPLASCPLTQPRQQQQQLPWASSAPRPALATSPSTQSP